MTLEDVSLYLLQMGARTSKTSRQVRKSCLFFVSIFFQIWAIISKPSGKLQGLDAREALQPSPHKGGGGWIWRATAQSTAGTVFDDCCGWCDFRTCWRKNFQWTFRTAPFGFASWAKVSRHFCFWIRLDSDFDTFYMKDPIYNPQIYCKG